jgi:hypothetical protein
MAQIPKHHALRDVPIPVKVRSIGARVIHLPQLLPGLDFAAALEDKLDVHCFGAGAVVDDDVAELVALAGGVEEEGREGRRDVRC